MTPVEPLQSPIPLNPEHAVQAVAPEPPRPGRAGAVWRSKWLILGFAIVAAVATFALSSQVPARYQASATVQVTLLGSSATSESVRAGNDLASQYAQIVTSDPIVQAVAKKLDEPAGDLRGALAGGTVNDQNLIAVRASSGDAAQAGRRATAAAEAMVAYVGATNAKQLRDASATALEQLRPFDEQITRLRRLLSRASETQTREPQFLTRQQSLATLEAQRAAVLGDIARSGAAGRPVLSLLNPAGAGGKVEPKPALYSAAAFLLALLVGAQLAAYVRAARA